MEITLRTKAGLEAIEKIANEFPSMIVGAGTVCDIQDYRNADFQGVGRHQFFRHRRHRFRRRIILLALLLDHFFARHGLRQPGRCRAR